MSSGMEISFKTGAVLVYDENGQETTLATPVTDLKLEIGETAYIGAESTVSGLYAGDKDGYSKSYDENGSGKIFVQEGAGLSAVTLQYWMHYTDFGGIYKNSISPSSHGGHGGAIGAQGSILSFSGADFTGNSATGGYSTRGGAIDAYVATLTIQNSQFTDNTALSDGTPSDDGTPPAQFTGTGGAICVVNLNNSWSKPEEMKGPTVISNTVFTENRASTYGGAVHQQGGTITITDSTFTGNSSFWGGAIELGGGSEGTAAVIRNTVFNGNEAEKGGALYLTAASSAVLSGITLKTESDTIWNEGQITFSGQNFINAAVKSAENAAVIFDMTESTEAHRYTVSDLGKFSGGTYQIHFRNDKLRGFYTLAENISGFSGTVTLKIGDTEKTLIQSGTVAADPLLYQDGNVAYTLITDNGALKIRVHAEQDKIMFAKNTISIHIENEPENLVRKINLVSAEKVFSIATDCDSLCTYGLTGSWTCSVSHTGLDSIALTPETESSPQKFSADTANTADVFFARVHGIWTDQYRAKNTNTEERIAISGKNRLEDVFLGDSDAGILYLTDTENGDVLFLDDIYSFGGGASRIAALSEIHAGFGDDIVDMTSTRYTADLENIIVRGGDGCDIIWGCGKSQFLFGDNGNDILSGGIENDILSGGSGNDILTGGGGNDIFCFGGNWGTDTVGQNRDGSVTLWFENGSAENWDAEQGIYDDGNGNTVAVEGTVSAVIFGDSESVNGQTYADLKDLGAFAGYTAEKVFENENSHTILAAMNA